MCVCVSIVYSVKRTDHAHVACRSGRWCGGMALCWKIIKGDGVRFCNLSVLPFYCFLSFFSISYLLGCHWDDDGYGGTTPVPATVCVFIFAFYISDFFGFVCECVGLQNYSFSCMARLMALLLSLLLLFVAPAAFVFAQRSSVASYYCYKCNFRLDAATSLSQHTHIYTYCLCVLALYASNRITSVHVIRFI